MTTVNKILVEYFKESLGTNRTYNFASHTIEQKLPPYGFSRFNKMHTPSTYARAFRDMREKKRYPETWEIVERTVPNATEKLFTITVKNGETNATVLGDSGVQR